MTTSTVLFDIGGVMLSNGWDHEQRRVIADQFGFDYDAFDARHRQVVDTLERGHLTLDDYLQWTIFYESRSYTVADVTRAIKNCSTANDGTIEIVKALHASGRYLLVTLNTSHANSTNTASNISACARCSRRSSRPAISTCSSRNHSTTSVFADIAKRPRGMFVRGRPPDERRSRGDSGAAHDSL